MDEEKDQSGKIVKLLTSHYVQIRSVQVLNKKCISIQPIKNLRHIESAFDKNVFLSDEEAETIKEHAIILSKSKNEAEFADGSLSNLTSKSDKDSTPKFLNMDSPCTGKLKRASARLSQKRKYAMLWKFF